MRQLSLGVAVIGFGLVAVLPAQQRSILFAPETDSFSRSIAGLESSRIRNSEAAIVTPQPGFVAAKIFLSAAAQWAYLGDANNNGRLVDDYFPGPGNQIDAIVIKRFRGTNTFGPRDIYFSKATTSGMASNDEDGNVFRFAGQNLLETFVSEAHLLAAIGQNQTDDINTDAMCQTPAGDLFLSFDRTEQVNGTDALSRAIIRIPASGITYNLQGNVIAIQSGVAEKVANAADVAAMISASGVKHATRAAPSTNVNLTALDLDPAGGTWISPQTGATLPNLLFAWTSGSNDGAIISTAAGGSIAVINGVSMGSTVETTGTHLGLLPDRYGIDGLIGLAVFDQVITPEPSVENWPTNLVTTGTTLFVRQEVSNATPGGLVGFFVDFAVGSTYPAISVPGFGGEIFGSGLLISTGTAMADQNGYCSSSLQLPTTAVARRLAIVWQIFDAGSWSFGLPAAMQLQ